MRKLAERLNALETQGKRASEARPAAFRVCARLRPHLATLMGSTGFHALLSRALTVASADDAWLRTAQVTADGSLSGGDEAAAPSDPKAMAEGSVTLVSELLGLLVAFIGEKLTLRMVSEVWPRLPLDDFDSTQPDQE